MQLQIRSPCNHYFCSVYHCPNGNDLLIFDLLSPNIGTVNSPNPSCRFTTLGDFNVHNRDWLLHSSDASIIERKAGAFAAINNFCQLVDLFTWTADHPGYCAHNFHLILTSVFSSSSITFFVSLFGSTNHCLISLSRSVSVPNSGHLWR